MVWPLWRLLAGRVMQRWLSCYGLDYRWILSLVQVGAVRLQEKNCPGMPEGSQGLIEVEIVCWSNRMTECICCRKRVRCPIHSTHVRHHTLFRCSQWTITVGQCFFSGGTPPKAQVKLQFCKKMWGKKTHLEHFFINSGHFPLLK